MQGKSTAVLVILLLIYIPAISGSWRWQCNENNDTCIRTLADSQGGNASYTSLEICRLACSEEGNLWPKPYKLQMNNKELINIDTRNITFNILSDNNDSVKILLDEMIAVFKQSLDVYGLYSCNSESYKMRINFKIATDNLLLDWDTNESYKLLMSTNDTSKLVKIHIKSSSVFGARHGLETLLQLIETDVDPLISTLCFKTVKACKIIDRPFYKHRGYGSYSDTEIYESNDIRDLISFAQIYGVQIIPEIDGPAHAGNGWQWGMDAGLGNLIVCDNWQPWRMYCIQPPCGQLNPANPRIYEILKMIYKDILDIWQDSKTFHMGGDEVFIPCWNSSQEILDYIGNKTNRSETVFLDLWNEYQERALETYDSVQNHKNASIILWSSSLTEPEHIEKYLSKDRYVIQTWVPATDPLPETLINLGYKLIISTKDKWYLDHGFWGNTVYHSWRNVYDNQILINPNVLGGEVCMWGELVDDNNIEPRIWPRAAAAAERLWSNLNQSSQNAENRFFLHNQRLRKRGDIRTSLVIPNYCVQNENDCNGYL